MILCLELGNLGDFGTSIRIDGAPGLVTLTLRQYGIHLELGRVKNSNKNPIAEKVNEELELLHVSPKGGPVSNLTNARIRRSGLSARELWIPSPQRDQISGLQLPIEDRQLICDQAKNRAANHWSSGHSKSHKKTLPGVPDVRIGHLVFLGRDRDKIKARDR